LRLDSSRSAAGARRHARCDIGIALDGDADRLAMVCEKGEVIDGEPADGHYRRALAADDRLTGGGVVATVMSNLGLERFIDGHGLKLVRTQVGDRYVAGAHAADGFNLGGEQSGHIIMTDHATTGDGLMAALQALSALIKEPQACERKPSVPSSRCRSS